MAKRSSERASGSVRAPSRADPFIVAGLDALNIGFAIFDNNLKLVGCNKAAQPI